MNRNLLLILVLLLIAGVGFWLWPNDEKAIRKNLHQLADLCSTQKKSASIANMTDARGAAKLCAEQCSVEIESFRIQQTFSRKEISQHILLMKRTLAESHFAFKDITITFPSKTEAKITATLFLRTKTMDQRFTDAYELDIVSQKKNGDWLFSAFTVVEFMER